MKDAELEKLNALKEKIIDNLESIKLTIEEYTELGMPDPGSELYNEAVTLIEDTEVIDIIPELELIIDRSKSLETKIESYLAIEGQSSLELEWPHFPQA